MKLHLWRNQNLISLSQGTTHSPADAFVPLRIVRAVTAPGPGWTPSPTPEEEHLQREFWGGKLEVSLRGSLKYC